VQRFSDLTAKHTKRVALDLEEITALDETVAALDKTVDSLRGEVDDLEETVDSLKGEVDQFKQSKQVMLEILHHVRQVTMQTSDHVMSVNLSFSNVLCRDSAT
jgi:phage shock protein A